jgi:hypothetical protein
MSLIEKLTPEQEALIPVYRKLKGLRPLHLYVAPISVGVCLEKSLHLGKAQDRVSR